MDLKQIKVTLESESGRALKEYLLSRLEEMRSIENITEYQTVAMQTLELKATIRAYKKLRDILNDLIDLSTEVKVKDPRDDYSVY